MLLLLALLMSAGVLYGALYWLVMPLRLHDKLLFFDYGAKGMVSEGLFSYRAHPGNTCHPLSPPNPLLT